VVRTVRSMAHSTVRASVTGSPSVARVNVLGAAVISLHGFSDILNAGRMWLLLTEVGLGVSGSVSRLRR
jgi:hypothetical protein